MNFKHPLDNLGHHLPVDPKHFWDDFRKFAFKGNLLDLAVAVVIGNAFGAVVNSLVKNVVMPAISTIMPGPGTYREWKLGKVEVGAFLGELVNFTVVSLAMFFIVVVVFGRMRHWLSPHADDPKTKECPYCISVIPIRAVRCSQCTSELVEHVDRVPTHSAS